MASIAILKPRPTAMSNMPTSSTQSTQPTSPQKRPGRQRGSQGYSGEDCTSLVEIIKGILPLGSNEWEYCM
ncbi:hypothetical protein VP01_252g3 [Puccinia sorghi]|uniref:Uncharacterized protein n=1 Tax=Puccinia sorghi TaxID=27349 RepID=A0A0L6V5A6_9BASI|nr:hypothetical protein VP01_252g3 [Puccinia sorghi]